ncbi:MAG: glycosyltransferase, partial [Bacteroidetes bacterium]|nr:glycosyltransferase [Bacteroidota bacterium]
MSTSLVSVIIPTYNRETYIEKAISSVAEQTYPNIEIIVVDDGSQQNYAKAICDKFSNCQYTFKNNGGLSSARNHGIRLAKGNYIAFLDDDDYWHPVKIEEQVAVLEKYEEVDLVHCFAAVVDENNTETGTLIGPSKAKVSLRSGNVFWNALGVWVVKSPTPLIRRTVFEEGLMFDDNIKVGEDIDFYQRLFYKHMIYFISETLAYYRVYE